MREVTLHEVCKLNGIQTGPFGSQLHQSDYSEQGTPVIMPVNLIDGCVSENGIARVSEEHIERLEKYKVSTGDIVYSRRGDVGRCSRIGHKESGWLCGTGCLRITPNPNAINPDYLFYMLSLPSVIGWVRNNAKGTTMPNLNTEILSSVPLIIEESPEKQQRIADTLKTYDSLIENNRKQIKLLEEAAQRLYKEWFIDLRFPGHETANINPETGLPGDWTESPLACLLEAQIGGGWGEETLSTEFSEMAYVIRATDIGDVENGSLSNIPLRCHKPSNLASRALRDGDIIFEVSGGSRDHGVGRNLRVTESLLSQLPFPVMCASFCKKLRPKSEELSLLVAESIRYAYLTEGLRVFEKRSAGNIINFHWDEFLDSFVLKIPPANLLETFLKMVDSIHKSKMLKASEMKLAREARDRLLPKLMSGELEV